MRTPHANDLRPAPSPGLLAHRPPSTDPPEPPADRRAGDGARAPTGTAAQAPPLVLRPRRDLPRNEFSRFMIGAGFAAVSVLMRLAVRVYFRRLHVRHRARFPRSGPVLLISNHPAMWTDVLVLDVALRRKLHFLAQGELFRPAIRGFLLELHGALPVFQQRSPESHLHNEATFDRCRELFARGEVVAIFPEGVSATDRQLLKFKTGAARIALDATAHAATRAHAPRVLAAGIYYADRTSYGSEVTVSLGEPMDLGPWLALHRENPEAAVGALTDALHGSLRSLILDLPEPALAAAVSDLEPLAGLSPVRGAAELESAQRVAASLEHVRRADPGRFSRIRHHALAYRRARRALKLSDQALHWDPERTPWLQRTGLLALYCVLGAAPAALGALLHLLPWAAGEWIAHSVGRDPTRFAFARISSGLVFFPVSYVVLFIALTRFMGVPLVQAAALLIVTLLLGLFTLHYARRVRSLWERVRFMIARWIHPRLLRRAQREQRGLLRLLADAARGEPTAGPAPAASRGGLP